MIKTAIILALALAAYVGGMATYKWDLFPLNMYRDAFAAASAPEVTLPEPKPSVVIAEPEPVILVKKELEPEPVDPDLYDFDGDPIGKIFFGEVRPAIETALVRYLKNRRYATRDFPLSAGKHDVFQNELREMFYSNINTDAHQWNDGVDVSDNYTVRELDSVALKGLTIDLRVLRIKETGDDVPVALCLPNWATEATPAIMVFSGHTINSGLFDLLIDNGGYQKAMSKRLCEAGFITLTVEKIDSGYTSVRFQKMGKDNIVEREPGGGGDDELELATTLLNTGDHLIFTRQTLANLAAFDMLLSHPLVDRDRIGATGVSFGGWQALHLALLRDEVDAISNFGGMWSYFELHIDQNSMETFEGVADYSQAFPGIQLIGDQNRFVLAVAGKQMQIGYGHADYPYTLHKPYFYPVVREQYEALGAQDMLTEVTHDGGHEFPPELVLGYFSRVFK